jgi:hypothetical protein
VDVPGLTSAASLGSAVCSTKRDSEDVLAHVFYHEHVFWGKYEKRVRKFEKLC